MIEKDGKYKLLARLSIEPAYLKALKPEMEKIKEEVALGEGEAKTIEEAAFRDVKRTQTLKVINRLERYIEQANSKVKI